jgi:hypothetical protein
MINLPLRRLLVLSLAWCVWSAAAARVAACPFCTMQGQTLTGEVKQASMVLFGTLTNQKLDKNDFGGGSADLVIETALKKDPILGDKKVLTLPRYIPEDKKYKYLIFCDVFQGKIDPYRGIPVPTNSDIVKYLKGAVEVADKDVSARLRFFFDYLANSDVEISNDAYKEFANADYKDYADMAKSLPADKIAQWLQDPNTPAFRYGLYASMLGHCGTDKHAAVLREMLDDPKKRVSSGIDGILAGYTMLKPKEGWAAIRAVLQDADKEFMLRYAALRAIRFFWDSRPDILPKKDLLDGICLVLDQGDIADLAIEDLRQRGCWDVAERVIGLYGKKSHDVPIIRRAILRYALSCQQKPVAAALVKELRQKDPEMVKGAEDLLKLETKPVSSPPTALKK